MPAQINKCVFAAPPFIPVEFRGVKMPSNAFFTSYQFTMLDMLEPIIELQKMYGAKVPKEIKSKIDKGE